MKTRIENISQGFRRYRIKHEAGWNGASINISVGHDRREDALFIQEAELVGIEEPKRKVAEWLLGGGSAVKVISVVGMGGLGKTTLIKKVYDDLQVKNHFQAYVWINVSQSFRFEQLLKDIIRQLFHQVQQPVPERVETMDRSLLKASINEFLKERRYVLVLDDVWSINDWDGFKYALPDNNNGSRVMLTTRVEEVALRSKIEFHGHMYSLKPLSFKESWVLFCRKTFYIDSCPHDHLIKSSESILKKCEGLPLAIVAISGVLTTKDPNNVEEWEMVNRSLGVELQSNHELKSVMKILSLGFNDLPYYLKSCFLYLSIFPEDYLIERMRLIRLWIAEGFIQEKLGKTPEEVADGYLNALFNRSMVQIAEISSDGRVKTCRIHDLIREMILFKSKDQIIVAMDSNTTLPEKVRCLSIHGNFESVNRRPFFPLRSLFMFQASNTSLSKSYMPSFFSSGLKLLKVLDLTGAALEHCPDKIGHLLNLRYLSLRDTKVKKLPDSIGNLIYLETLDLKGTNVTKLPVSIFNLQKLRHLLVYRYNKSFGYPFPSIAGFKAPSSVTWFPSLQKLTYIEVDQDNAMLIQIGSLIQLRRLGITKLRKEDGKTLCSSIQKLCNLRSLSIQAIDEHEIIDLQSLDSPPEFLRFLELGGHLEKLPNWISSAHNLKKVSLRWSRLVSDPLETLGALPNLVDVELFTAYDGDMLCFKAGCFQRLKKLWIDGLNEVTTINVVEGAMVNLEELYVGCCKMLKRVPSGVENLANLRVFTMYNMPDELTTLVLNSDYENGEFLKIAHVPEVLVYNLG